jgi:hypothetical protein
MSEMFRTAVGHTLYVCSIIEEIREELNISKVGKTYSGIYENIGAHYVRNGRETFSQVSVLKHFNRQKKHRSISYKTEKPTPMMKENSEISLNLFLFVRNENDLEEEISLGNLYIRFY